jgi:glycosyltransferase involved in cell wall biosynthesis
MDYDLPLVSIVIPAHNHAAYLGETIESILAQDYPRVELLVLDDGSTDSTRKVLKKYTGQFYWDTHRNVGQSATLNKGWRMSQGEILAYLSADDVLLPTAVSTSVKHLQANPNVVATYGDFNLIYADSTFVRRVKTPEFSYRELVAGSVSPIGPGLFFRRKAFGAAGGWNESLRRIPDYEYLLRLGLQGEFLKIPDVLAAFRVHEGSTSFEETPEMRAEEFIHVMSNYYSVQQVPDEVFAVREKALSNAHVLTARIHFRSRRYRKGFARLLMGLRLYPRNLSPRTLKIVAHGFTNHIRHRLTRKIMKASLSRAIRRMRNRSKNTI